MMWNVLHGIPLLWCRGVLPHEAPCQEGQSKGGLWSVLESCMFNRSPGDDVHVSSLLKFKTTISVGDFFFPSLKSSVKFMHLNVIIHIFYRIGLFIWAIIFWLHYPKWLDLCLVVLVCSGQRGGAVSWTVDRRRSRMDEGRSLCGDVGPQRCGLVYCVGLGTVAVTTSDLWNKNPFVLWTGLDAYLEYGIRSCLHSESGVFHGLSL